MMRTRLLVALILGSAAVLPAGYFLIASFGPGHQTQQNTAAFVGGHQQKLGPVKKNEKLSHVFKLKNSGIRPISVSRVKASCGCLEPHFAPGSFKSGEAVDVSVTIVGRTSANVDRPYSLTAVLNDGSYANVQFFVDVLGDVDVYPERPQKAVIFEKDVFAGELMLREISGRHLSITAIGSEKQMLRLSQVGEMENGALRLKYSADRLPIGEYEDTIRIESDAKIDSVLKVPVSWKVESNLIASPAKLYLGIVRRGDKPETEFVVKSVTGRPLTVASLHYDRRKLQVDQAGDEDARSKDAVKFRVLVLDAAPTNEADFNHKVVVKTNEGEVSVVVTGLPSAD